MWIRHIIHHLLRSQSLRIICYCGIAGILVDIDHPIAYYWLTGLDTRFLHIPLLISSSIVLCGCYAYIGGLYVRMVLREKEVD